MSNCVGTLEMVYEMDKLRREFIAFRVPYLCTSFTYIGLGYWDYPSRVGWEVHHFDRECHRRCPPGNCIASDRTPGDVRYGVQTPCVSRMDDPTPAVQEKVTFFKAWLFFGALTEVSSICGLSLDLQVILSSRRTWSIQKPSMGSRWDCNCTIRHRKLGFAGSMKLGSQLRAIARRVQLTITRGDECEDEHQCTSARCEVLCSIVLLRILFWAALRHAPH